MDESREHAQALEQSAPEQSDPRLTYAAVLKAWDADDDDPAQYQEYLRDS